MSEETHNQAEKTDAVERDELPHDATLRMTLINHRFACRLDHARLLASAQQSHERIREAKSLIREIAMHRVFDRFTPEQEIELRKELDPLVPVDDLANLPFVYQPPEFTQPHASS